MNIGIDARVLERKMTGVGRYLLDLLTYIPNVDASNRYYLFSYGGVDVRNPRYLSVRTAPRFVSSKLYSPLWLLTVLPKYLKSYEIDILFSPNFLAPRKQRTDRWRSIVLVHDAFLKLENKYFSTAYTLYMNSLLQHSIAQSNAIVTNSEYSKKDIVKYYSVAPEKVHVIYPSKNSRFNAQQIDEVRRKEIMDHFKLPLQFVLCVGVLEVRKNVIGLTRIADILKHKGINVAIVLIGGPGFGFKRIIKEVNARNNIMYLGQVDDEYLPDIYKMASAFVFPSFYEGFGSPPLEAMQCGTPVVTSNTSSLPEVVGEAGNMFHPDDAEAFANEIIRLLQDREYHKRRSDSGIAQARKFNAQDSASSLVQLFTTVGS